MFDCVIATRHARSGTLYTDRGRIRLTDKRYRTDMYPIDANCSCYACKNFTRAYIHHLLRVGEVLGSALCTIHNLAWFHHFMSGMRKSILEGCSRPSAKRYIGCIRSARHPSRWPVVVAAESRNVAAVATERVGRAASADTAGRGLAVRFPVAAAVIDQVVLAQAISSVLRAIRISRAMRVRLPSCLAMASTRNARSASGVLAGLFDTGCIWML